MLLFFPSPAVSNLDTASVVVSLQSSTAKRDLKCNVATGSVSLSFGDVTAKRGVASNVSPASISVTTGDVSVSAYRVASCDAVDVTVAAGNASQLIALVASIESASVTTSLNTITLTYGSGEEQPPLPEPAPPGGVGGSARRFAADVFWEGYKHQNVRRIRATLESSRLAVACGDVTMAVARIASTSSMLSQIPIHAFSLRRGLSVNMRTASVRVEGSMRSSVVRSLSEEEIYALVELALD